MKPRPDEPSRAFRRELLAVFLLLLALLPAPLRAQAEKSSSAPAAAEAAPATPAPTPAPAPAPAPAAVAPAPLTAVTDSEALIQAGSVLEVRVYQEPDLDVRTRVAADGRITLNLIGDVAVAGMKIRQARDLITAKLKDGYLVNPQVTVTMDVVRKRFTIMGEVLKPGPFYFPENGELTLLQAVAIAGGYSRNANKSKITIKRKVNGRDEEVKINGKEEGSARIQPGDIIDVAESRF